MITPKDIIENNVINFIESKDYKVKHFEVTDLNHYGPQFEFNSKGEIKELINGIILWNENEEEIETNVIVTWLCQFATSQLTMFDRCISLLGDDRELIDIEFIDKNLSKQDIEYFMSNKDEIKRVIIDNEYSQMPKWKDVFQIK